MGNFDAGDALQAVQYLRDQAGKAYASGDKPLGRANREISEAIEGQIERFLGSQGQNGQRALATFRDARKTMAKAHTLESSLTPDGNVNAAKLAQRVASGKPLDAELETIGRFASSQPKSVQLPERVAGAGVSAMNAGLGTILGGGNFLGGGDPATSLALAVGPAAARALIRKQILSRGSQNALMDGLYSVPLSFRTGNALAQYAPAGGAVLGLEAFGQ